MNIELDLLNSYNKNFERNLEKSLKEVYHAFPDVKSAIIIIFTPKNSLKFILKAVTVIYIYIYIKCAFIRLKQYMLIRVIMYKHLNLYIYSYTRIYIYLYIHLQ